jgi:hypothetical protein
MVSYIIKSALAVALMVFITVGQSGTTYAEGFRMNLPVACNTEIAMSDILKSYGEQPYGSGVAKNGKGLFQLFVSPKKRTFTFIVTLPKNEEEGMFESMSCMMGSGDESWNFFIPPQLPAKKEAPKPPA